MYKREDIHHVGTLQRHNGNGSLVITTATYHCGDAFTIRAILALFEAQIVGMEKLAGRCVYHTDLPYDTLAGLDASLSFPAIASRELEAKAEAERKRQAIEAAQAERQRLWEILDGQGLLNHIDNLQEFQASAQWRHERQRQRDDAIREKHLEQNRIEVTAKRAAAQAEDAERDERNRIALERARQQAKATVAV